MRRLLVGLVALLTWSGVGVAPATAGTGPWVWPVDGPREVSRAFAPPASTYGTGHRGADLLSVPGAAVRSAGAGRVSYAGLLAGRGVVVVEHGSLRTTYEPVEALVAVDEPVAAGQVIGTQAAGHGGCPSQACLHWGLRRGETYLDPVRLVLAGPVRLLPIGGAEVAGGPGAGPRGGTNRATPLSLAAVPGPAGPAGGGPATGPVPPGGASAAGAAVTRRPSADAPAGTSPQAAATAAAELDPVPVSAERLIGAGLLAVALLAAGLALLARRPSAPPSPPAPPAGSPARAVGLGGAPARHHAPPDRRHGDDGDPPVHLPVADLLDLQAERIRRRGA